jgi:hypothetical protein
VEHKSDDSVSVAELHVLTVAQPYYLDYGTMQIPADNYTKGGEWGRRIDQHHRLNRLGSVNPGRWLNLGIGLTVSSGKLYC